MPCWRSAAGGLRRYLGAHAELPQADLAAIVPLGVGADRGTGAASRRIRFGTCIADPVQRLAWIHAQTSAAEPVATEGDTPLPSCTITHVPGPPTPVYLHGARMTYFSAILPIADGMGLVFAVSGYDGRIVVSPTSCRELMPDPQAFTQCVRDSFQEYLALARAAPARGRSLDRHGLVRQQPIGVGHRPGRHEPAPRPFRLRKTVGDDPQHHGVEAQPDVAARHADVLVQRRVAFDRWLPGAARRRR